jgi:hypothetical protein
MKAAALVDDGTNGALDRARATIQQRSPQIYNEVKNTLPTAPGQPNIAAGAPQGPADPGAAARLDRDIQSINNTIASTNKSTALDPARKAQSISALTGERDRLMQQRQALGGGVAPAPVAAAGGSLIQQQAQQKANIEIGTKRSESFNKHIDENITPDAVNGDSISSTRKQQFAIFDRPGVDAGKIFGIANGAGSAPGDQRWTMFRDILLGKVSEPADQIRQRAAALGLNREEQSAVAEYAIANADINSKTLKGTAGPGSVSEAEQKINQARNVDPTLVPMLGGYNAMAQSQFNGDLARYKGDWATSNTSAANTAQLEKEWRKEKEKYTKIYADTAKQRIEYIAGMGNTPAAIKEGYRRFPVPQYDSITESWIKKKPIGSYEK